MKKFIKIIAIIIALSCFSLLFACNKAEKPLLDLSEARDNLEDRNYPDVDLSRNVDDYFYGAVVEYLEAENDDDDFIEIYRFKTTKLAKTFYNAAIAEREGMIEVYKSQIKFYEEILDSCSDDIKSSEIDEIEDLIKENKDEIKEIEKIIIGISGKYVWIGTIGAIEDTH